MMYASSPGSARARATGSASIDVLDLRVPEADRDVEAALAGRGDRVAAQQLVRHVPQPRRVLAVGDARVHGDRRRRRAVGRATWRSTSVQPAGFFARSTRRVPPVAERHAHEAPGDGRHARAIASAATRGVDAEVRRRGDEREGGVRDGSTRRGARARAARDDRRGPASSPSRRCAASGWANPHAGQSNRSARPVEQRAARSGTSRRPGASASPSATHVTLRRASRPTRRAGRTRWRRSRARGAPRRRARHASPTACTSP